MLVICIISYCKRAFQKLKLPLGNLIVWNTSLCQLNAVLSAHQHMLQPLHCISIDCVHSDGEGPKQGLQKTYRAHARVIELYGQKNCTWSKSFLCLELFPLIMHPITALFRECVRMCHPTVMLRANREICLYLLTLTHNTLCYFV